MKKCLIFCSMLLIFEEATCVNAASTKITQKHTVDTETEVEWLHETLCSAHDALLTRQNDLLRQYFSKNPALKNKRDKNAYYKNYSELKAITAHNLVISKDVMKKMESSTDWNDISITINLEDANNVRTVLKNVITDIQDELDKGNEMEESFRPILSNTKVVSSLTELLDMVDNPCTGDKIYLKLQNVYDFLCKDNDIGSQHIFTRFIYGIKAIYQVSIARELAKDMLQKGYGHSKEVTKISSKSFNAGVTGKVGMFDIGTDYSFTRSKGTTDSSFYTVSSAFKTKVKGSVDFGVGSVGVAGQTQVSVSEMCYSLEEMLDKGLVKGVFLSPTMKNAVDSRKAMQNRERELLGTFSIMEGYLKVRNIIPQTVHLALFDVTKSAKSEKAVEASASLAAELKLLNSVGLTGTVTQGIKKHYKPIGDLFLIDEHCCPIEGMSAEKIADLIGVKYDQSSVYLSLMQPDEETNKHMSLLREKVSSKISKKRDVEQSLSESTPLSADQIDKLLPMLHAITGDITWYVSALQTLSEKQINKDAVSDEALKKAERIKHDTQKRWKVSTRGGRSDMFKTAIVTAVALRKIADDMLNDASGELDNDTVADIDGAFCKLYQEIWRLAKMQEFSKSESKREEVTYTRETSSSSRQITGEFSVNVPTLGEIKVSLARDSYKGSPFQDENGDYMDISFSLPMGVIGTTFIPAVRLKLDSMSAKLTSQSESSSVYQDIFLGTGYGLEQLAGLGLSKAQTIGNKVKVSVSGSTGVTIHMIKTNDSWKVQYVFLSISGNSNTEKLLMDKLGIGKSKTLTSGIKIAGSDTFTWFTKRYNAFALGLINSSLNENLPWKEIKNDNTVSLTKLFCNVAKKNTNAYKELKQLREAIKKNAIQKYRPEIDAVFEAFNENCKNLKNQIDFRKTAGVDNVQAIMLSEEMSDLYSSAVDSFDKIMELNYKHNFLVEYNKAYGINDSPSTGHK